MALTLTALLVGIVLGMRHALEPDHLTAVSTLTADEPGMRRGALLGALWGLGHTASLFAVAVVLALLQARLPARVADLFELAVGVMLVALGVRAIVRARQQMRLGAAHAHRHRRAAHRHAGARAHVHLGRSAFATRTLVVGMVHGLAGSGALTAMVLPDLPSTAWRLAYVALFGAGSLIGMAALSGAIGAPLALLGRDRRARAALSLVAGGVSATLGVAWAWPIAARLGGG